MLYLHNGGILQILAWTDIEKSFNFLLYFVQRCLRYPEQKRQEIPIYYFKTWQSTLFSFSLDESSWTFILLRFFFCL